MLIQYIISKNLYAKCLVQRIRKKKKKNNFTINRRQDRIRIGYVLFYYIHIEELILDEGHALYLE